MQGKKKDGLAREVLDRSRLTLEELAGVAGVSRSSLNAYRSGRAAMPPRVRLRLAMFLTEHAEELQGLAEALAGEEELAPQE